MKDENQITIKTTEEDLNKMLKTEISRIDFMESVIKGMYQKRVTFKDGTVEISLTPSELSQLITAESNLFDLRRKVNGVLD